MRKIICIGITSLFILSLADFSWAMIHGCNKMQLAQKQENATPVKENKAVDVGNKICPVSGEKINEKSKATYEYEGKTYNFCCMMCVEEFRRNPKEYIEKVEEELKGQNKAETKEKGMPEGHHH